MKEGLIIGFGNMGVAHADRFSKLGTRISIADPLTDRQEFARSRGLLAFPSEAEAIQHQKPDFISICTPTNEHAEIIEEAILNQRGPLFVEKPVVRTTDEADRIRHIARDYPYPIFVGEVELFNPEMEPFLNYSGTPKHITISRDVNLDFFLHGANKPWFLNEELSGGIILDLMIHDITLLMSKYGRPRIGAVSSSSRKYGCIDDATAELLFDGFAASVHSSWTSNNTETPITTHVNIEEENRKKLEIECESYAIRNINDLNDAFLMEDQAFLLAIGENKAPYPLELFLDAVEVANEITSRIRGNTDSVI